MFTCYIFCDYGIVLVTCRQFITLQRPSGLLHDKPHQNGFKRQRARPRGQHCVGKRSRHCEFWSWRDGETTRLLWTCVDTSALDVCGITALSLCLLTVYSSGNARCSTMLATCSKSKLSLPFSKAALTPPYGTGAKLIAPLHARSHAK